MKRRFLFYLYTFSLLQVLFSFSSDKGRSDLHIRQCTILNHTKYWRVATQLILYLISFKLLTQHCLWPPRVSLTVCSPRPARVGCYVVVGNVFVSSFVYYCVLLWCDVLPYDAMWCGVVWSDVQYCYAVPCYRIMLCYVFVQHAMLCCILLCYLNLRFLWPSIVK